jgi:dinuclear metal center YbgI/SA1388 family protein
MQLTKLQRYLDEVLEVSRFKDYCPNGLQVEGRATVGRIVTGVTASQVLLDAAVALDADAILVHHGYFWRGEDGRVVGIRRRRLSTLLRHDISLFAFHLPLDAHAELGNNAWMGELMDWSADGRFGDQDVGFVGRTADSAGAREVAERLGAVLGRPAMLIGDPLRKVCRVAWCSGAAQGWFEQAIAAGADLYVSGEISEQTVHLARESGIPYIAAGHHATERGGVQALGARLREAFGLDCRFIDDDNPV